MRYDELLAKIRGHERRGLVELAQYGEVQENGRGYPLVVAVVPGGERQLVITTGFHGEEPSGPLTMGEHLGDVARWMKEARVGGRIYVCINPSGFEAGHRYNASAEKPNNDFLRYEVAPGVWKDQIDVGESFLRWVVADDGPKETRALRAELDQHAAPDAALDIHQDDYLAGALTYAYTFGPTTAYLPMMREAERYAQVVRNAPVDERRIADENGMIVAHDGSVTDYYMRRGVPYAATLETTTRTPADAARAINLIWIRGFIELAARRAT
jgi:predicted deacylase